MIKLNYYTTKYLIHFILGILKIILPSFSYFFKQENNNQIYFLTEKLDAKNIRLIKIATALNRKDIKPILIINNQIKNYSANRSLFKKIIYYKSNFQLIKLILKIKNEPLHSFVEGRLHETLIAKLFKKKKFFFDNYDQAVKITDDNLKTIIEEFIIKNSINVCRSSEIKLLNIKNLKHFFFTDYFIDLNTNEENLKFKINKSFIDFCYIGKIKSAKLWGKRKTYDFNFDEIIFWFSKFKKINFHIFPSKNLDDYSVKEYENLSKKFRNIYFYKTLNYNDLLKKIRNFDFGIHLFPIDNWPNQMAFKKHRHSMGNKIFDYFSSGMMTVYNFKNNKKLNWFAPKFLNHYSGSVYINTNWNEEKIFNYLKENQRKIKLENINKNLITKHIDRLIQKYFN